MRAIKETEQDLTKTIAVYGSVGIGPDITGWWVGNRRVISDIAKDGTPNVRAGETSYGKRTYHPKLWMACLEAAERVADKEAVRDLQGYADKLLEVARDLRNQLS